MKLGIIVPYRNRKRHLSRFKKEITKYLGDKNIDYEIIIVDQDHKKDFNRGKLLNIGFTYAKKLNCDYVVFHDVDMLPIDVDYSYSDIPLHLSTNFIYQNNKTDRVLYDEYFGGVTLFPVETFAKINGYSNNYWGWGFEDDDLLLRCKNKDIKLDTIKIENIGKSKKMIELNGVNSYIRGNKNFNLNDITIFISFYPDKLNFNYKKESDIYTIFSIPGYSFSISYNSFLRYSFITFDNSDNVMYLNSNIKTNYKTNITITINLKEIVMYQDGIKIGMLNIENKKLHNYNKEKFFFIGCDFNNDYNSKERINYFSGYFDMLGIFSKSLNQDEIYQLSNNKFLKINKNEFSNNLILGYDSEFIDEYKLIDLSGNKNDGLIFESNIKYLKIENEKKLQIPYRRKSIFSLLHHRENGFYENKWREKNTRWNQLKFYNDYCKNPELSENDGLSDLNFTTLGVKKEKKITTVFVEI